jgi:hypothetical protein
MAKSKSAAGRSSWLDDKTDSPLIDDYARDLNSFLATMADGHVTDQEMKDHEKKLVKLLKEVEPLLDDNLHEKVTRLLCEVSAYSMVQVIHGLQEARPKSKLQL